MTDGLTINLDGHLAAFHRMAATSKKTLPELWKQEAKLCFGGTSTMPGVANITPPYSAGGGQNTRTAQKMGEVKVAADIHSLYGTPAQAYDALHSASASQASAFWFLHQQNDAAASDIVRAELGKSFVPFDGGKLHQQTDGGAKRRRRQRDGRVRDVIFFVSNPAALEAYIKTEQSHVWWLASGWAEPLRALGARLPAGVKKLPAPGHLRVITTDALLEIAMVNDVKFAGQIADMQRRIQTVFNTYRVARLDKMWDNYMAKLAGESGLKKTG